MAPYTKTAIPSRTNRAMMGTAADTSPMTTITKAEAPCFTTLTSLSQSKTGNFSFTAIPALAPKRI